MTLCVLPVRPAFFSTNYIIFSSGLLYKYPLCISPLNTTKSYIVEKYHIENTSTILLLLTQCFCLFVCLFFVAFSGQEYSYLFPVETSHVVQFKPCAHVTLFFSLFFASSYAQTRRQRTICFCYEFKRKLFASVSQVGAQQQGIIDRSAQNSRIDIPFSFFFLLSSPFLFPFVSFIPAFAKQYGFECDCTTLKTACPFFVSPFLLCFFFPLKQRLNAHLVANNINFRSYYCTDIYNGRYTCISFLSDI